jgi:hypothetical protein
VNIDWVIPCRYAEVHDNLATMVGAGIDTFWVPGLPAPIQVAVVVRLLATADELGPDHDHTVRNIIRSPDGEPLSEGETATFQIGTSEEAGSAREDWLNGIELITMAAFEATEPGTYTFELTVDGSTKATPLHVAQGQPGAGP